MVKLATLIFRNASEKRGGISMYMTNEGWEQNNQDYLKESYEKTDFTAGGLRYPQNHLRRLWSSILHHVRFQKILS